MPIKSSLKKNPEHFFWEYFLLKSHILFDDKKLQQEFPRLLKELKSVHSDLTFEIGPIEDQRRKFIISADGIIEAFPSVLKLVKTAPILERWEIVGFRPRKGVDLSVNFKGLILEAKKLYFKFKISKNKIDLKIYVPKAKKNDIRLHCSVYILLDGLIGEYDVETKVGTIEIEAFPDSVDLSSLMPLDDLPKIVDLFSKERIN